MVPSTSYSDYRYSLPPKQRNKSYLSRKRMLRWRAVDLNALDSHWHKLRRGSWTQQQAIADTDLTTEHETRYLKKQITAGHG